MKHRLLLPLLLLLLAPTAATRAEGFGYLTLVKADGTELSLPAHGLTLTFDDGTLTATHDGTTAIPLADLRSMQFTSTATGLDTFHADNASGQPLRVYSPDGRLLRTYAAGTTPGADLPRGIYLIRRNGQTTKIAIP